MGLVSLTITLAILDTRRIEFTSGFDFANFTMSASESTLIMEDIVLLFNAISSKSNRASCVVFSSKEIEYLSVK
jgi:hypothetical protein